MISDEQKMEWDQHCKHSEVQIIAALQQVEAGRKTEDVVREHGVSKHTIYAWKAKYGGWASNTDKRRTAISP